MNKQKRDNAIFWALLIACCAALAAYAVLGVVDGQAQAEESSGASAPPTLPVSDEQALEQEHRSHSVEAVEAGKVDKQGEPIDPPESEPEAAEGEECDEAEYEPVYEYYGAYTPSQADNGDGFITDGVRYYNGTTETWYSSNILYHHRTPEWTPDSEGYYRDSDGYYVVASTDYAQGEVIQTSKGDAKVYDSGCNSGVTDFYTNF